MQNRKVPQERNHHEFPNDPYLIFLAHQIPSFGDHYSQLWPGVSMDDSGPFIGEGRGVKGTKEQVCVYQVFRN